jgi:pyruvate dehydrogenase E1 component
VVAVSDFMHSVVDQIRPYVPTDFATLGADGFGFSDTRAAARRYFAIDTESIVVRVLEQLAKRGEIDRSTVVDAFKKYRLNDVNAGTTGNVGGDA